MINGFKVGFIPTLSYADMDVESVCKSLKKIGYDSVEWTLAHFCPKRNTHKELMEKVKRPSKDGKVIEHRQNKKGHCMCCLKCGNAPAGKQ